MNDADHVHEIVHPRPRMADYLKLIVLTVGMVTVVCLASRGATSAVGVPVLFAPAIPTATFIAFLARADLPAIPEGGHLRAFLTGVGGILYAAGVLSAGA